MIKNTTQNVNKKNKKNKILTIKKQNINIYITVFLKNKKR